MLSQPDIKKIADLTVKYWRQEVKSDAFRGLFAGKEIGHRIADFVDERTTALLRRSSLETRDEVDRNGRRKPRSMGDVWVKSNGIYNPVNVKAGEAGKKGQPNMVSLTKLVDGLLARQIDSYYVLIVKMRSISQPTSGVVPVASLAPDAIVPNVYLVDLLDWTDHLAFDAGPGQVMLKERQFYSDFDAGNIPPHLSVADKVGVLIDLLEDGNLRLAKNRAAKLTRIRGDYAKYRTQGVHMVNQEGLTLG